MNLSTQTVVGAQECGSGLLVCYGAVIWAIKHHWGARSMVSK
jgi:hypothetical protein